MSIQTRIVWFVVPGRAIPAWRFDRLVAACIPCAKWRVGENFGGGAYDCGVRIAEEARSSVPAQGCASVGILLLVGQMITVALAGLVLVAHNYGMGLTEARPRDTRDPDKRIGLAALASAVIKLRGGVA